MPDLDYTDDQDQSEVFDEDSHNLDGEGQAAPLDLSTFEDLPRVLDVTAAPGDGDDDGDERPQDPDLPQPGSPNDEPEPDTLIAGEAASFEAEDVSDEDLIDLGYAERGEDGELHARR